MLNGLEIVHGRHDKDGQGLKFASGMEFRVIERELGD
jgi:hypothetical protein